MHEQVRRLEEGAVLGELLDGIAAVQKDASVAVDVGDAAGAGRRVHECRVVDHEAVIAIRCRHLLEGARTDRAVLDGDVVRTSGPVVGDGQAVRHGALAYAACQGSVWSSSVTARRSGARSCVTLGAPTFR